MGILGVVGVVASAAFLDKRDQASVVDAFNVRARGHGLAEASDAFAVHSVAGGADGLEELLALGELLCLRGTQGSLVVGDSLLQACPGHFLLGVGRVFAPLVLRGVEGRHGHEESGEGNRDEQDHRVEGLVPAQVHEEGAHQARLHYGDCQRHDDVALAAQFKERGVVGDGGQDDQRREDRVKDPRRRDVMPVVVARI